MVTTVEIIVGVLSALTICALTRANHILSRFLLPGLRQRRMLVTAKSLPWLLLVVVSGCASQQQVLSQKQGSATNTALERAKFEMNCPSANATVLSQDFIQPAIQGPWVAGLERVEYTVGVEGCNQRKVYIILCQVGSDTCFAASPDTRFRS
jgi:hypothetical protein